MEPSRGPEAPATQLEFRRFFTASLESDWATIREVGPRAIADFAASAESAEYEVHARFALGYALVLVGQFDEGLRQALAAIDCFRRSRCLDSASLEMDLKRALVAVGECLPRLGDEKATAPLTELTWFATALYAHRKLNVAKEIAEKGLLGLLLPYQQRRYQREIVEARARGDLRHAMMAGWMFVEKDERLGKFSPFSALGLLALSDLYDGPDDKSAAKAKTLRLAAANEDSPAIRASLRLDFGTSGQEALAHTEAKEQQEAAEARRLEDQRRAAERAAEETRRLEAEQLQREEAARLAEAERLERRFRSINAYDAAMSSGAPLEEHRRESIARRQCERCGDPMAPRGLLARLLGKGTLCVSCQRECS